MGGSAFSKLMINMQVASETGMQAKDVIDQTGMSLRELELFADVDGLAFKELANSMGLTSVELKKYMKHARDLDNFAKLSGVTAEQFAKAYGEDAAGALARFIDGLGGLDEEMYRITLFGQQIISIEKLCNIVAAHGQMPYIALTQTQGNFELATNTIYRIQLTGNAQFILPEATPGCQDQIMIYLTVASGVSVTWSPMCIYVLGLAPLLRAGKYYRVVLEHDPNAGRWSVGAIESEAAP